MAGSRQSLGAVSLVAVDSLESFGALLRRRRHIDDVTQAELGKLLGVSQQTIGAWERGERPQSRFLGDLATYLRMDKQKLLLLIDGQPSLPSRPADVDEAAEESADANTNDAIMRQLAQSFMEAQRREPLSPQSAEAYSKLFAYFGPPK